jgi:uncharacterized oligopeptide transporter (OPT) family protein
MNKRKSSPWPDFFRLVLLVGSLVVAVCVLAFGVVIFWNEFWNVPRLVYGVLPTYVVKDQHVNGLVVENRGHETAHKVLIRVTDLDQPIESYTIKTNEQITAKEGDEHNISVWLDRIVPGSSVTLYVPTAQPVSLDKNLSITSEEGLAVPASGQQDLNTLTVFSLVGVVGLFLVIIGGGIGWALARLSARG